jgi:hypothetical protein
MLSSMTTDSLPAPDHARNMRLLGWSDQGGRPDGVQIMVHRGHAYIGHMFSRGFSIHHGVRRLSRHPHGGVEVDGRPAM